MYIDLKEYCGRYLSVYHTACVFTHTEPLNVSLQPQTPPKRWGCIITLSPGLPRAKGVEAPDPSCRSCRLPAGPNPGAHLASITIVKFSPLMAQFHTSHPRSRAGDSLLEGGHVNFIIYSWRAGEVVIMAGTLGGGASLLF